MVFLAVAKKLKYITYATICIIASNIENAKSRIADPTYNPNNAIIIDTILAMISTIIIAIYIFHTLTALSDIEGQILATPNST